MELTITPLNCTSISDEHGRVIYVCVFRGEDIPEVEKIFEQARGRWGTFWFTPPGEKRIRVHFRNDVGPTRQMRNGVECTPDQPIDLVVAVGE